MSFTKAIVREPSRSMIHGIRGADLGLPDYEKAFRQHRNYIAALKECGVEIFILEADEDYPDSTFVEDTALLTEECAIITNPGAESRKGETGAVEELLKRFYTIIYKIEDPGTIEAGDVMMVGDHFFIGLSERTNREGAQQLISILEKHGMSASQISLEKVLHLKTGVSYLERNNLLACGDFMSMAEFQQFNLIEVEEDEAYSANCIWVNDTVIVPAGYPKTKNRIKDVGYRVLETDVSEFRKLDGGLSCLSLRF